MNISKKLRKQRYTEESLDLFQTMPSDAETMYRIQPSPVELSFHQYITSYRLSGDGRYFLWFLHYYEPHINKFAKERAQRYSMVDRWVDLKSEIVLALLEAAQNYEFSWGSDFLATAHHQMEDAVHRYVRTMRSGFTVHNDSEYKRLRSIMGEYHTTIAQGKVANTATMAQQRGISEHLLIDILQGALRNITLLPPFREDEEGSQEDLCQYAPDPSSDPAKIYVRTERDNTIYAAFQSLSYRERLIVSAHLGFCPQCLSCRNKDGTPIPKQSFKSIGILHELKEKAVARIYKAALNKIRKNLAPILF